MLTLARVGVFVGMIWGLLWGISVGFCDGGIIMGVLIGAFVECDVALHVALSGLIGLSTMIGVYGWDMSVWGLLVGIFGGVVVRIFACLLYGFLWGRKGDEGRMESGKDVILFGVREMYVVGMVYLFVVQVGFMVRIINFAFHGRIRVVLDAFVCDVVGGSGYGYGCDLSVQPLHSMDVGIIMGLLSVVVAESNDVRTGFCVLVMVCIWETLREIMDGAIGAPTVLCDGIIMMICFVLWLMCGMWREMRSLV